MKRWLVSILFTIALTACGAPATQITSTIILTSTPTSTQTPLPTSTPTPTETPDPLAGAPEGATGKNANGEWTKTIEENGKPVTYEWMTLQVGEWELSFWSALHIENGSMNNSESIPLLYDGGDPRPSNQASPLSINTSEKVKDSVPMFRQVELSGDFNLRSLAGTLWPQLLKHRKDTSFDYQTFWTAVVQGDERATIEFVTPDNVVHEWMVSKGYDFNWVSWGEMTSMGRFLETHDELNKDLIYRWTITTIDGKLVAVGAVEDPKQLSSEQIFKLVLNPMVMAVMNRTLSDEIYYWGTLANVISGSQIRPGSSIIELDPPRPVKP